MPIDPRSRSELSDDALVAEILAHRSERAARRLVERHSPRLLATVARVLGGDRAAAEDALQQAWINGIAALPRFRGGAQFGTWMTRIAIRAAIDWLRSHDAMDDLASDAVVARLTVAPDDVEGRLDVEQVVGRLPSGCRAVFVLHDLEGFTHGEIATTLGIAVGTSKAHLFRARRLLRGWLAPDSTREAQA